MAQMNETPLIPELPARPADAHKGTFGTVIVVGGSATMLGAPALCAAAALRGGAGLVRMAALAEILPWMLSIEPCATGLVLEESLDGCRRTLDAADPQGRAVLAVGPGLGRSPWAGGLVRMLLAGPRAVVLDADGLNLLAEWRRARPQPGPLAVLTPHPGEFARLAAALRLDADAIDPARRPAAAMAMARAQQAVVVLKGRQTVIADADGQRRAINGTGNPALATAGSGDVLTGLIAALLAQGMGPFDAGVLAAHLHGLAGDLWAEQYGPVGLTARDLIGLLPRAMAKQRRT